MLPPPPLNSLFGSLNSFHVVSTVISFDFASPNSVSLVSSLCHCQYFFFFFDIQEWYKSCLFSIFGRREKWRARLSTGKRSDKASYNKQVRSLTRPSCLGLAAHGMRRGRPRRGEVSSLRRYKSFVQLKATNESSIKSPIRRCIHSYGSL